MESDRTLRALVFGERDDLMEAIPPLLSRAGFSVCVVTTHPHLRRNKFIDEFLLVGSSDELVRRARDEARKLYDLIVIGDDETIRKTRDLQLPPEDKLRLLPIASIDGLQHLGSKIGLSRVLRAADITTPDFAVANDSSELQRGCESVGFPLFVKVDEGAGGDAVHQCASAEDVARIAGNVEYPVLIQKRIEGRVLDLSGLFLDGELVFFSYAEIVSSERGGYGPSSVRRYTNVASCDPQVWRDLCRLGAALHAHGFANISAILSDTDARLYFFEADMRPTVWVEYPKFFDADPAVAIQDYFRQGKTLDRPPSPRGHREILLGYPPRMRYVDILRNKHHCREAYGDYLSRNFLFDKHMKLHLLRFIKPYVSVGTWHALKRLGERVLYRT